MDPLEAEYHRLIEETEREIQDILSAIQKGWVVFQRTQPHQQGLLHPCTNGEYSLQFTYFDAAGPVGHTCENTIERMAARIHAYGFKPFEVLELTIVDL